MLAGTQAFFPGINVFQLQFHVHIRSGKTSLAKSLIKFSISHLPLSSEPFYTRHTSSNRKSPRAEIIASIQGFFFFQVYASAAIVLPDVTVNEVCVMFLMIVEISRNSDKTFF